jgi:hypothetical protein
MLRQQGAPQKQAEPEADLKALRKARNDALLEGDSEKAAEIEDQIDTVKDRQLTATITARAERSMQERELQQTAAAVARDYPFLDTNNAEANRDAIDETLALRNVYINKGYSWSEALRKAADRIAKDYGGKVEGDDLSRRRDALALSRGATAARAQPTQMAGGKGMRAANDSSAGDVSKMTDAEFRKLPESEKRRLRGD